MKPKPLEQQTTQPSALVEACNQFAIDLYRQTIKTKTSNLFFSPFSISTVLAMAYAGARGETKQEMKAVLQLPDHPAVLHPHFADLIKTVRLPSLPGCHVTTANRMWAQSGYRLLAEFVNILELYYESCVDCLDFVAHAESACQTINSWVKEQTKGKIEKLILPQHLNTLSRLILINAVYLRASWTSPFATADTHDAPFYTSAEQQTSVRMMFQQGRFAYRDVDDVQILELPYGKKGELSMVIFLPRKTHQWTQFEHSLSADLMKRWLAVLESQTVHVFFPKFQIRESLQLVPLLQAMGMASAFSPTAANFSGMTDDPQGLCISQVIHEAFVGVDETGTEAAAATAVLMGEMMSSMFHRPRIPPVFRADRPFVFLIRHAESATLLFLGRVMHPVQ